MGKEEMIGGQYERIVPSVCSWTAFYADYSVIIFGVGTKYKLAVIIFDSFVSERGGIWLLR
jgi:hypothetical protein